MVSKVPSLRCVRLMPRGESSADNDMEKAERAAEMVDSGMWKAGDREGIIDGVKSRTFGGEDGFWWEGGVAGGVVRRGRKVFAMSIGWRRRVFVMSLSCWEESVARGAEGYVSVGIMRRAVSCSMCSRAPVNASCGVER